jgi:hypothetical protein
MMPTSFEDPVLPQKSHYFRNSEPQPNTRIHMGVVVRLHARLFTVAAHNPAKRQHRYAKTSLLLATGGGAPRNQSQIR